jgi:hypothetical protein
MLAFIGAFNDDEPRQGRILSVTLVLAQPVLFPPTYSPPRVFVKECHIATGAKSGNAMIACLASMH